MSKVRRALDLLLEAYPFLDVISVDWQVEVVEGLGEYVRRHMGPWVLVDLGQPSDAWGEVPAWAVYKFAVWKSTGDVFQVGADGAVGEDPILRIDARP